VGRGLKGIGGQGASKSQKKVEAAKGWEAIKIGGQYFQTALFLPLP